MREGDFRCEGQYFRNWTSDLGRFEFLAENDFLEVTDDALVERLVVEVRFAAPGE
jgi:hypothetical protein